MGTTTWGFRLAAGLGTACFFGGVALAATVNPCAVSPTVPVAPGTARILSPSGGDDTAQIQQAINASSPGSTLVFRAGTYTLSKNVNIGVNGLTLFGSGATLHSTSPTDGGLLVEGDNVAVYGFTLTQDSKSRQASPWSGGIAIWDGRTGTLRRVQGTILQNNTIDNAAAAGIFIDRASNFTVANNTVYRSWADGIHMTGGSSSGRVINNVVQENGDDMIAVVSYEGPTANATAAAELANLSAAMADLDQNIYVGSNQVSNNYWGRGISVVGGTAITIDDNTISRTAVGAAVYVIREGDTESFGDHNILVMNNAISQVQTSPPSYMPAGFDPAPTGQAAIDIESQMSSAEAANPTLFSTFSVSQVEVIGNQIQNAASGGTRAGIYSAPNSVSQVVIDDNVLNNVGANTVTQDYPGLVASTLVCSGNSLNGVNWGGQCDQAIPAVTASYAVTGAPLQCRNGSIIAGQGPVPLPPSNLIIVQ